ncbi:MAG: LysR family transcriptional regulator, partial [Advenella sp.]
MAMETFNDVLAFVHVVRAGSFTRASAQLGVSPSALSHAVRGLETRLGVQLLTRTTRSIATTEAGDRLFSSVAPRFDDIDAEVAAVKDLRDKPVGSIRITSAEHAATSVLWPKLSKVMRDYPDIHVEITIDYTLGDIVSQRFDAGVRMGDQVAKDMIAVRISPDLRMAVVGTHGYFATRAQPRSPLELTGHDC